MKQEHVLKILEAWIKKPRYNCVGLTYYVQSGEAEKETGVDIGMTGFCDTCASVDRDICCSFGSGRLLLVRKHLKKLEPQLEFDF